MNNPEGYCGKGTSQQCLKLGAQTGTRAILTCYRSCHSSDRNPQFDAAINVQVGYSFLPLLSETRFHSKKNQGSAFHLFPFSRPAISTIHFDCRCHIICVPTLRRQTPFLLLASNLRAKRWGPENSSLCHFAFSLSCGRASFRIGETHQPF